MDQANQQFVSRVSSSRKTILSLVVHLNDLVKRLLDVSFALLGLIFLAPLFVGIGILLRRAGPDPVFYGGRRVGRNGKEFSILKFWTMKEAPDSRIGPKVTANGDPRITPLGRWLRDSKINELPQLWNVLIGEMSLVGPRPEDPEIVATWPAEVRQEVLSVRPGITSPASVLYRNEEALLNHENVMQTYLKTILPSKLRLDQLYVKHRSLLLDFDVLLWTVLVLLPILQSPNLPENLLFLGPISKLTRRYFSWFVVDTVVTLLAIGTAGILWRAFGPLQVGWEPSLGIAIGFAFLFSLTGALLGMNRIAWSHAWASDALGLLVSATLAASIALVANQMWDAAPLLPPSMIVFASVFAFLGFVAVRYRSRLISGFASRWLERAGALAARERVLIVGSGYTGQFIAWLLASGNHAGAFQVVGFVDDDLYKQGMRYHGISVIGGRADIPRVVKQNDVGTLMFAIHNISAVERERLLAICRSTPAKLVLVPDIVATLNGVLAEKGVKPREGEPQGSTAVAAGVPLFTSQGIPLALAQLWLAQLERAARSGDRSALNDQINAMREGIQKLSI